MTAPALPPWRPPISARAVLRAARLARSTRLWLWVALVGLLLVMQSLLVVLTLRYEEALAQERTEEVAVAAMGASSMPTRRSARWWAGRPTRCSKPTCRCTGRPSRCPNTSAARPSGWAPTPMAPRTAAVVLT